MCLIVDTNVASLVFAKYPESDFTPIIDWLTKKDGRLVIGGRLLLELEKLEGVRRFIRSLLQAGRARRISDSDVEIEQKAVIGLNECKSNNFHVIALARVSGARVLCSHDSALHSDFKNKKLITNPRGRIYQNVKHVRLLCHTESCGWRKV